MSPSPVLLTPSFPFDVHQRLARLRLASHSINAAHHRPMLASSYGGRIQPPRRRLVACRDRQEMASRLSKGAFEGINL
jgi:hypothetical protein